MEQEILLKVKFPANYPIIYKMVKMPREMTVFEAVDFIATKYGLKSWIGNGKMGLYENAEHAWLDDNKTLAYYFPDLSLVENIDFRDKSMVSGKLAIARGPYGDLFTASEVDDLRTKLANLGSLKKVSDKRQAVSMRLKVDDRTRLEEVQKQLAEKEQDTATAAEIGQTLLDKNIQLEKELGQIQGKVVEYQRLLDKMEEIQTENLRIRTRNLLLESQLSEANSSNSRLWEALDDKNEELEQQNTDMKQATTATLKQRERVIKAQVAEIESLQASLEQANTSADALKKSNLRMTEKNDTLEAQIAALTTELREFKEDSGNSGEMRSKINFLTQKNRTLEEQLHKLEDESELGGADVKQGLQLLQSLAANVSGSNGRHLIKTTLEQDKALLTSARAAIDRLVVSLDAGEFSPVVLQLIKKIPLSDSGAMPSPRGERDAQHSPTILLLIISLYALQRQAVLEEAISTSHSSSQEGSDEIDVLRAQLAKIEKQKNKLQDLNDGLQAWRDEHEHGAAQLQRLLDEAVAKTQLMTQQLEEFKAKATQHEQDVTDRDSTIAQLRQENKDIAQQHTEQLLQRDRVIAQLTEDHHSLSQQLNQQSSDRDAVIEQLKQAHTENVQVYLQQLAGKDVLLEQLQAENKALREKIVELERLLEELRANNTQQASKSGRNYPKDYSSEEEESLVSYINIVLAKDPDLEHILPVNASKSILYATYDGLLLCKLINLAAPGTIDERVLNMKPESSDELEQNQTLCLNSAKAIGCRIQNLTVAKLENPLDVIELIWEIVRIALLSRINLTSRPQLAALMKSDEEVSHFAALPAAVLVLRWINYHLNNSHHVENFSDSLKDGEVYAKLIQKLAPEEALPESAPERVDAAVQALKKLTPTPFILKAHHLSSAKLNLAQMACLMNAIHGLPESAVQSAPQIAQVLQDYDSEGSREERAFVMWINSLGINTFVTNLTTDMRDGLVVLQVLDKICPGTVSWSSVNMTPNNSYKMLENCNLGIKLAKGGKLNFSLVGIDGSNFHNGDRKLILALIWQACKYHILSLLKDLGGGKEVSEGDLTAWANSQVTKAGKSTHIDGFKDTSLATGHFLLDLVDSVRPRVVLPKLVTNGESPEDRMLNAKYVISLARKIGCTIFLVWEDIVEVKPKMILTLVGSLMMCYNQKNISM